MIQGEFHAPEVRRKQAFTSTRVFPLEAIQRSSEINHHDVWPHLINKWKGRTTTEKRLRTEAISYYFIPSLINTYKIVTGYIHILITRIFLCTYPEQPVCTSLPFIFILLFIKSQYTFFAHLIVLHFLFHCTFYSYFSFLPYICSCVVLLLYNSYFLLFCTVHWADLIWFTFHFWLYP